MAGSANAFRHVDLDYVTAAARAAGAAHVPHFSLVSAQGANPNVWTSDLSPFHGLLYMKVKGLAEEAAKAQGFAYTTLMRPGMLERGELTRPLERMFMRLTPSVPASGVAAVMIRDAEAFHAKGAAAGDKEVRVYEMKEIQRLAKELAGQ